ncbi:AraC family transcriptional regulator [Bacillus solitudinis]|uniref:AraC family transcriptional regulator n=1 Tax=Bacillus solitudinis TaxID=2014074 RepID=UPI000C2336B8|nr:helix-turn-helix domain-containing protein [Bacillus solitudinis]
MSTPIFFPNHLEFKYCCDLKEEISFHSHEHYEIFYFHGGKCNYLIGDQIYVLAPGDLILMNGLTLHCPTLHEREDYIRSVIHFDHGYFRGVLRTMGMEYLLEPFASLQSHRFQLQGQERQAVERLFLTMNQHNNKDDSISGYRLQLAFLDLLAYMYTFCQKPLENKKEAHSEKEKTVQKLIAFIEEHFRENLTLQDIEDGLHLSKYYLSKIFKEVTGFTIFNYFYQKRVNQAKIEFLLSENNSVTDVGYRLGFKHPSHFSKVFKNITGLTPEQYKKEVLTTEIRL